MILDITLSYFMVIFFTFSPVTRNLLDASFLPLRNWAKLKDLTLAGTVYFKIFLLRYLCLYFCIGLLIFKFIVFKFINVFDV